MFYIVGVDFNIEAADDIEEDSTPAYLDTLAPLGVPDTISENAETEQVEASSANEDEVSSVVINGSPSSSSPPTVKKKRPYIRRSIPKSDGPLVKLLKLSPSTITKHTNGESTPLSVPVSPHREVEPPETPLQVEEPATMPVPLPVPKKRTVNGPNLLRNKQVKKKVVVNSKTVYRKPNKTIESQNRTSVVGVKPLGFPTEDSGLVECVKCFAIVGVSSAREHLSVCGSIILAAAEENDIGTHLPSTVSELSLKQLTCYSTPITVPSLAESISPLTPLGPPPPLSLPPTVSPSKSYGTRASSIRSVQSTYGPDACGLCGARGLSDGLSRYLHAHLHHQRHACLVCGSMHAKVSALVKHLQAVHGKEDRWVEITLNFYYSMRIKRDHWIY